MKDQIMICSYLDPHTELGVFAVATSLRMADFFETLGWTQVNGGPKKINHSIAEVVKKMEDDSRASRVAIRQGRAAPINGGDGINEATIIVPPTELTYLERLVYGVDGNYEGQ